MRWENNFFSLDVRSLIRSNGFSFVDTSPSCERMPAIFHFARVENLANTRIFAWPCRGSRVFPNVSYDRFVSTHFGALVVVWKIIFTFSHFHISQSWKIKFDQNFHLHIYICTSTYVRWKYAESLYRKVSSRFLLGKYFRLSIRDYSNKPLVVQKVAKRLFFFRANDVGTRKIVNYVFGTYVFTWRE